MPAMLEDPSAPPIYRTSGAPPYPIPDNPQIPPTIAPIHVTLRDRITTATIVPFAHVQHVPPRLLDYLCQQFALEVEKGDTYPMMTPMPPETFGPYWFQSFGAIMFLGEIHDAEEVMVMEQRGTMWEQVCFGSFYIKANYPGRSSHVCNGGFLVTTAARNKGVGRLMGEAYLDWAPKLVSHIHVQLRQCSPVVYCLARTPVTFNRARLLTLSRAQGYTYSVFNLVYETNVASCRIWDALGFKRIGRIKKCGNLRSHPDELVDAIIYGRDLGPEGEDFVFEERFDKIRFYLKHNKYPDGADRAEKSRLRSAATHYRLVPKEDGNGEDRLMLKDKEVVSDPQRQYEIARSTHALQHGGINKTTAAIAEQFHWVRIKETVSLAIKNCPQCKEPAKDPSVRPMTTSTLDITQAGLQAGPEMHGHRTQQDRTQDPHSVIDTLAQLDDLAPPPHNMMPEAHHEDGTVSDVNLRALQEHLSSGLLQHSLDHYGPGDASGPLDPRIMSSHSEHHHPNSHPHDFGFAHQTQQGHGVNEAHFELDFNDGSGQPPDKFHREVNTNLATQRHVRNHDDPMSYVDEGHS